MLGLMPYSTRFHAMRRLIHKELTGSALRKYEPLHEQESRSLIKSILQDPPYLQDAIRQWVQSLSPFQTHNVQYLIILQLRRICHTEGDLWIPDGTTRRPLPRTCGTGYVGFLASKSTRRLARRHHAMEYVRYPLIAPIRPIYISLTYSVRHIPDWFPGAKFKRVAAHWKRLNIDAMTDPYLWVKANQV
jgi:hypothetical protein